MNDDKWRKETQQKIKEQRDRIGALIQKVQQMPKANTPECMKIHKPKASK